MRRSARCWEGVILSPVSDQMLIQAVQHRHVVGRDIHLANIDILDEPFEFCAFGQGNKSVLQRPAENDAVSRQPAEMPLGLGRRQKCTYRTRS